MMKQLENIFSLKQQSKSVSVAGSITLGLSLITAMLLSLFSLPVEPTRAAGPDQAHIIVQSAEGDVIVRKINFTAPISGYTALQLTGLELITTSTAFGLGICAIEGVGDPAGNCFTSGFWSSYYWNGLTWTTYLVGASDTVINNGAVELWSWQDNFIPLNLPPPLPITAAANGLEWLQTQQSETNGGYGNASSSVETLFALGANKLKATTWRRQADSPSLAGYVLANGATLANTSVAGAGKLAIGLSAVDSCWPSGAKMPLDYYDSATGVFDQGSGFQAWAMLGTRALSQAVPAAAGQHLRDLAQANGGWEWAPGWGTDTNSTALAIQALIAAGEPVSSAAVISGVAYLDNAQNDDGGFPYDPDSVITTTSDANSTAYVVQALLAAGEVLTSARWTTISDQTPINYLLNLRLADGSFQWQAGLGPDQIATRQAIPALLGRPFPIRVRDVAPCAGVYLPSMTKN